MKPTFTKESKQYLVNYYLKIRSQAKDNNGIKAIPISARQLEGLIRLSEAYAKLRLSKKIEKQDAKNATEILDHCLKAIAFDEETGTVDIDKVGGGVSASQRSKISIIKGIIDELEKEMGKNIPKDDLVAAATSKALTEDEVEATLNKLKSKGDIFEPRRGYISRL